MGNIKQEDGERRLKSRSRTPQESRQSPQVKSRSSTPSSNKPPKLSRKASQPTREPPLFGHLPDFTDGATQTFQVIPDCLYGSKHLGSTDNDALDCDCRDEWLNGENMACGEDSDCINRATKMECGGGGGNCGDGCQNQRFQRKEYANVSVIKTEKKGFGLRIDSELQANDFIFEYIGEVINEPTFRRRMVQYDQEGIKHFYFMSLNKNEFVDATKKGNLGRFCNHSCSPNCYVDKWVVGDKLRMGIFALRKVRAGEELVFNYNVDRYGADPQPCYCDEPNCVGFIGGKTQTERATKLPAATVEALGIDGYDGWDTTVAKRPRKKRVEEDDEDYVNSIQPRGLDEEGARKVMATLMQCKEKWIAVKLLERIQRCDEERVILSVMRMHAYQILRSVLTSFNEDEHVILQVLLILDKFPRLTRNKIRDSNIEAAIEPLKASVHSEVAEKASKLLDDWSKLQVAFRIGRRKVEHVEPEQNATETRQGNCTEDTLAAQKAAPLSINAPKGPRSMAPQRQFPLHQRPRPRPFQGPLPVGWSSARDASGNTYFYDKQGTTTWTRPTQPAAEPGPNRAAQEKAAIQSIIDRVTKEGSTPKPIVAQTARASPAISEESKRQAKWRSLPIEKQMKIYENTIFPAVKYIIDKYRQKLPKDELKRLGKEVTKNLVASDYKKNRVQDPSIPLTEKGTHQVKKAVTQYMDRAVAKYGSFRDGMTDNKVSQGSQPNHSQATDSPMLDRNHEPTRDGEDMVMSDVGTPASAEKKRKREDEMPDSLSATPSDDRDNKRSRENGYVDPSPPPPPPPPGGIDDAIAEEQRQLREQEEALMRENEEAQRLDDEANYNGSATNGSGHA